MENCETCRFRGAYYVPPDRGTAEFSEMTFKCHRNAPIITGGVHTPTITVWPFIRSADWCGEWEPTQGMAARSDETAKQAQPEGQERGPKASPE